MDQQDEILTRIKDAFRLYCRSEVAEGRRLLHELWEELGPEKGYHRSVTAHYLADTQVELEDELMWDLRALAAAESLTSEAEDSNSFATAVRAFFPSLHLNLADAYRRLGNFEKARHHAEQGMATGDVLGLDHYGQTVRGGLIRVQTQIDELDKGPAMIFDFD
ncbi:hypothetical protein BH23ACT12_BH23ACT12_22450 [soil metagenome]